MGFLSLFKKNDRSFEFSDGPPSQYLPIALDAAARRPLDDLTYRVVVATPERFYILDVGLVLMSSASDSWELLGIQEARIQAVRFLRLALGENPVVPNGPIEQAVCKAALAFFDREFRVDANKGKTHETAWNTLVLEVENRHGRLVIRRSASRLELPDAPIDLSYLSRIIESTRREG